MHLLAGEDRYDGVPRELEREWVREEVAGVLRLAPGTAGGRLHDAAALVTRLPSTLAMLASGSISLLHPRTLVDATSSFDAATTGKIEAGVLERAGTQTLSEFRRTVAPAVLAADPRQADEQHTDAAQNRNVRSWPEEHEMATVKAYCPPMTPDGC